METTRFCPPKSRDSPWDSPNFLLSGHKVSVPGVKRPGRDVAWLHPSVVQVKNLWSYNSHTSTGLRGWRGKSLSLPVWVPKMIWDTGSDLSRSRDFFSVLWYGHTPHILLRASMGGVLETETVYSNLVQKLRISSFIPPFPHTPLNYRQRQLSCILFSNSTVNSLFSNPINVFSVK